jgi:hypothetical protein
MLSRLVKSHTDGNAEAPRGGVAKTWVHGSTVLSSAQTTRHQDAMKIGDGPDNRARMTLYRLSLPSGPMYEAASSAGTGEPR